MFESVHEGSRSTSGWTLDAGIVLAAGIGLTFGLWWTYFAIPWADILHHHRDRWGYGHMLTYAAIAAGGAGLHVAQYYLATASSTSPAQAHRGRAGRRLPIDK
jgi:hypothetical protein